MTEADWLTSRQPLALLTFVRPSTSARKLRLFACSAARRVLHMLSDSRCRRAVEVAERFADGQADTAELRDAATAAARIAEVMATAQRVGWNAAQTVAMTGVSGADAAERAATSAADADMVREVFGNPFRPKHPSGPDWSAWNGGVARKLAQAIYDERRFGDLPALADALEEAGCGDSDLLRHLREPGLHARGCWVVDLVLDKT
jgi:hypothetical protein